MGGEERLAYGQRPIREVRLRSDQRDPNGIAGEVAQSDERLEPGDTPAGDDDMERFRLDRNGRVR
jgi:hypothetical protein